MTLRSTLESLINSHAGNIEPDSSKLNDNMEAVDMEVASPLSDEGTNNLLFPPPEPPTEPPPAPEKGVSFSLPPDADAVPSSAVDLDNQQKVSCVRMPDANFMSLTNRS
jgi:hypothetical protein